MKKLRALLLASSLVAGCSSEEPVRPFEFPEEPVRRERAARDPEPSSEALAPVDRWRRDLERIVPAGWVVEGPIDQLEAPDGWSREEGGRGLAFVIEDRRTQRKGRFVFSLFPRGWKGRSDELGLALRGEKPEKLARAGARITADPARFFAASGEWILFHGTAGHAGWDRPEEDVARALGIPVPPRG